MGVFKYTGKAGAGMCVITICGLLRTGCRLSGTDQGVYNSLEDTGEPIEENVELLGAGAEYVAGERYRPGIIGI